MSTTQTPNPCNATPQNQPTGLTPQGPAPSNTLSTQTIQDLQTHVAQGGSLSLVSVNGDIVGGVRSNVSSNLFNNLRRSLHLLSSDVNALVQTQGQKKPTIRASNPEKFPGNSLDVENFIRDINASIAFQESSFTSDHLKAEYFGSFLGKQPRAWCYILLVTP
ncbi:hypothetical protein FRC03_001269 [Tulasnella sp. 419]|nr:hypothetical protein FRC03_001269 [Tulasnella sp. 419]